jgi:putative redox protein
MAVSIKLHHGMTFDATTAAGFTVRLDTSVESGGENAAPRPTELLLASLGGCTAMDVISILRKKQQAVSGFEVRVEGVRATDHPRVYTDIAVEYIVTGHAVDPAAVERAIELSVTKYCTVHAMLTKAANITHSYRIVEDASATPATPDETDEADEADEADAAA